MRMTEDQFREAARKATGDEGILDIAIMVPKDTIKADAIGAGVGALLGGSATGNSAWGGAIGASGGMMMGREIIEQRTELPATIVVAVTNEEVYLLGAGKAGWIGDLTPFAKIDRKNLGVTVKNHVVYSEVILEDATTGAVIPLEMRKLNWFNGKALIELLMLGEDHHDPDAEIAADLAPES